VNSVLWQPSSACGPRCRPGGALIVRAGTALVRLAALIGVLLSALLVVPLLRRTAARTVSRGILAALGVELAWRGPVPRSGSLLVANHVSWLDAVALLAVTPARLGAAVGHLRSCRLAGSQKTFRHCAALWQRPGRR